jgi:hypothetical protein
MSRERGFHDAQKTKRAPFPPSSEGRGDGAPEASDRVKSGALSPGSRLFRAQELTGAARRSGNRRKGKARRMGIL